jgi:phosphoenolpyruvate-protein phosphotransferase
MDRDSPPDEEEQYQTYRQILETMGSRPVVVRMLDIGGDKPAPYLRDLETEMNPFLGLRGVRLTLDRPQLMQNQIRALLRAGVGHNLKIMFPMVGVVEEIRAIHQHFQQAREALEAASIPFIQTYEVGIMVELPAAALMADILAKMVDFVSIGTNDLAQYTLAADRTNAKVSALADALQPAVLRLIRLVIEAVHAEKKWVGLCGELAGEPLAVPVLLGLGLDEFSMNARAVPLIKQQIRSYNQEEAQAIAAEALKRESAQAVREYLASVAR